VKMAMKTEKDRHKAQQEKFQAILSALLKDEDNKYCEDCDAKGPRWASWNLGIFLCIRCAGIHRNLGVHISRVKSVNLDSWTPEQVAMMQEMGNSRARAVYEANIPETFRRPQTDSALEAYIRSKYEQKKYIAREWVPPKPTIPKEWFDDDKDKKKAARSKPPSSISLSGPPASQPVSETRAAPKPAAAAPAEVKAVQPQPPKPKTGTDDLLGLDFSVEQTVTNSDMPQQNAGGQGGDLLADLFGGSSAPSAPNTQQNGQVEANLFGDGGSDGSGQGEKKSTKDSILALYGSGGGQQQMFGVPGGMYMPQQQIYGGGGGPMPGMMGNMGQQGMMGGQQMGQQGMMGMQQVRSHLDF
jgi:stromal membrane-associated protein